MTKKKMSPPLLHRIGCGYFYFKPYERRNCKGFLYYMLRELKPKEIAFVNSFGNTEILKFQRDAEKVYDCIFLARKCFS